MKISYTYIKNRKCKHCLILIADQIHATQEYCKRIKLEDGSVLCCKDDFNAAKRKIKKAPFKVFGTHQENMLEGLRSLFNEHGEIVNRELLNQYGIILNRPAEIMWLKDGNPIFYFMEFAVVKTNQNQYKIQKHDKVFQ